MITLMIFRVFGDNLLMSILASFLTYHYTSVHNIWTKCCSMHNNNNNASIYYLFHENFYEGSDICLFACLTIFLCIRYFV